MTYFNGIQKDFKNFIHSIYLERSNLQQTHLMPYYALGNLDFFGCCTVKSDLAHPGI